MQESRRLPRRRKLRRLVSAIIHAPDSFSDIRAFLRQLHETTVGLQDKTAALDTRLHRIETIEPDYYWSFLEKLYHDEVEIKRLNRELSTRPTIWGEPSRLHISSEAAVSACFFNTNSGEITIGEYTFAGSGVSILAGAHDTNLTGFLRRDTELTEGCDIVIGKGVWLASNCTILGPCRIEDNAVIAAGAVVVPGTVVPSGAIYGGIPAKEMGKIKQEDDLLASDAVLKALKRYGGILFLQGWSEKKQYDGIKEPGHYLTAAEGVILTTTNKWIIRYGTNSPDELSMTVSGSFGSRQVLLDQAVGEIRMPLDFEEGHIETITVRLSADDAVLFLQVASE